MKQLFHKQQYFFFHTGCQIHLFVIAIESLLLYEEKYTLRPKVLITDKIKSFQNDLRKDLQKQLISQDKLSTSKDAKYAEQLNPQSYKSNWWAHISNNFIWKQNKTGCAGPRTTLSSDTWLTRCGNNPSSMVHDSKQSKETPKTLYHLKDQMLASSRFWRARYKYYCSLLILRGGFLLMERGFY